LLAIRNILQSSQRSITHIYIVENLKNTWNPSIIEPSFVHITKNTSWMERKIIIPMEKQLNGELVEPSFFQYPKNVELHNQQSEECNNGTMLG
jgi:hypothetical protein